MAGGCYGRRRLSELLQEQQEPFLLFLPPALHGHGGGEPPCCSALGRAARRALRWDPGYGCFPCGRREKFRRLPRCGGDNGAHCDDDDGGDGARQQLSPVSVLDVLQCDSGSDEEPSSSSSAPALSSWEEEDDEEASTASAGSSSPPDEQDDGLTGAKACAPREAMAALVELELSSGSAAQQWRRRWRLWEEEEEDEAGTEASRVAESIEAMIFEEIRAEAVRDMVVVLAPCYMSCLNPVTEQKSHL